MKQGKDCCGKDKSVKVVNVLRDLSASDETVNIKNAVATCDLL